MAHVSVVKLLSKVAGSLSTAPAQRAALTESEYRQVIPRTSPVIPACHCPLLDIVAEHQAERPSRQIHFPEEYTQGGLSGVSSSRNVLNPRPTPFGAWRNQGRLE